MVETATPETADMVQVEQKARDIKTVKKVGKFMGKAALWTVGVSTVLVGPGVLAGWRNARDDQRRLNDAKFELSLSKQTLSEDKAASDKYFESQVQTPACEAAVANFLPGGSNADFSNESAQLSLQQSHLCPADQLTLVSDGRRLKTAVIEDNAAVKKLESEIPGLEHDAAHNYELGQGAAMSAGGELIAAFVLSVG